MKLVMDVGNSNTVLGLFQGDDLKQTWRITTSTHRTADEWTVYIQTLFQHAGLDLKEVHHTAVASVVPNVNSVLEAMLKRFLPAKPLFVEPGIKTGLKILVDNPSEVGADRIVNAVAAMEYYGGPAIILDFGTATTFDAVTDQGEYLGGAITPGIGISSEALFSRAARLPRVRIKKPATVVGRNTVCAMQSGLYFGYVGQVTHILEQMRAEMGGDIRTIATGGFAPLLAEDLPGDIIIEEHLTLKGLKLLLDRNR